LTTPRPQSRSWSPQRRIRRMLLLCGRRTRKPILQATSLPKRPSCQHDRDGRRRSEEILLSGTTYLDKALPTGSTGTTCGHGPGGESERPSNAIEVNIDTRAPKGNHYPAAASSKFEFKPSSRPNRRILISRPCSSSIRGPGQRLDQSRCAGNDNSLRCLSGSGQSGVDLRDHNLRLWQKTKRKDRSIPGVHHRNLHRSHPSWSATGSSR